MAFKVRIANGPAEDWEYITMVTPPPLINVAPIPRVESHVEGYGAGRIAEKVAKLNAEMPKWMRCPVDTEPPWPGTTTYEAKRFGEVDDDGDTLIEYEVVDPERWVKEHLG